MYIQRVYGAAAANERTYVVPLIDPADNDRFLTSDPSFAAGDVTIYNSGTTWDNVGTLPTWIGNGCVLLVLTQAEQRTNSGMPIIAFIDQDGPAWSDTLLVIDSTSHPSLAVLKGAAGVAA